MAWLLILLLLLLVGGGGKKPTPAGVPLGFSGVRFGFDGRGGTSPRFASHSFKTNEAGSIGVSCTFTYRGVAARVQLGLELAGGDDPSKQYLDIALTDAFGVSKTMTRTRPWAASTFAVGTINSTARLYQKDNMALSDAASPWSLRANATHNIAITAPEAPLGFSGTTFTFS